jgi:hypothetical protein
LLERILQAVGSDEPSPILRITLRSWMALVETAGLDWLERRDLSRSQLERLLVDQYVVLLRVAGRHDPALVTLFEQVTRDDPGNRVSRPRHLGDGTDETPV